MRQGTGWSAREPDHCRVTRGAADRDTARRPYASDHRSRTRGTVLCDRCLGGHRGWHQLSSHWQGWHSATSTRGPGLWVWRRPAVARVRCCWSSGTRVRLSSPKTTPGRSRWKSTSSSHPSNRLLRRPPARPFDVVFADPPYEMETRDRQRPTGATRRQRMGGFELFDRG